MSARDHDDRSLDASSSTMNVYPGNFARYISRFDGSTASDVEAFIDAISPYEDCTLPMLLEDVAATWRKGVRSTIDSWSNALAASSDANT